MNNHTFIIAEAGSNWKCGSYNEDLEQARKLIKIAADAGADAVKFQTFNSESIYAFNAGKSNYLSKNNIDENINDLFKNLSMPYEMIPELKKICKNEKIKFMSTPFSVEDAKQVDPFVEIHKIASFEINHIGLLDFLSQTKKPIILSTGASNYEEIDFAINFLMSRDVEKIILLQCTSKYPCPVESLNISAINDLRQRYDLPVGLSDHSLDAVIAPVMAVSFGSNIIEKHFTLDKNLTGPDHKFALNPEELKLMVRSIRLAEKAIGHGKKTILDDERELRVFATRSIQATKNISKGDLLIEGTNIAILRPGNRIRGLDARFFSNVVNKRSKNDVKQGDGILEYY